MVFWQFTLRYRWCRQYHLHLHHHCYRCYGPSWIANCQPYGDFFFYLPITSDNNVELMIENFLSFSTNTIYEEEKKITIIENAVWKTHRPKCDYDAAQETEFLSGTKAYAPLSQASFFSLTLSLSLSVATRNIWHFFCHQKAINLSSVDSRADNFLRWKM